MESIPTEEASSVLRSYYVELIKALAQYLNDLLLYLVSEGVITIEDKNTIKKYGDTPSDKAEYLLDNYIDRPLAGGIVTNFVKLLKVMEKIPGCNPLVAKLRKALKCDKLSDTPMGMGNIATMNVEAEQGRYRNAYNVATWGRYKQWNGLLEWNTGLDY